MVNAGKKKLLSLTIISMIAGSLACSQPLQEKLPHRVITANDIQKAGDQKFQYVLHYLLPDVFPRTDQAWERTGKRMSIYVDNERFEPEYINRIRPGDVKRILIWETRWEPSPMSLPALNGTKYVVSIETIRLKQSS
ncbi:MAG TPA: hypothetical protein DEP53_05300 [Bacteroidetes bacterium]|nr:hypothetical protein [Bacteroidota bacterium]